MQVFLLYTFTGHTLAICRLEVPEPTGAGLLLKREANWRSRARHRLDRVTAMKLSQPILKSHETAILYRVREVAHG